MGKDKRRVLVVGGSFSGLFAARDLKNHFMVTVVDAKEFFEYTPGVLRAYVKPAHLDALTFTLQPVIEHKLGCKFIWGEVKELKDDMTARIKPIFADEEETIDFDYAMICAGCNFGPFHKWGESLWFPVIHEAARPESAWSHLDERFLEGRRRHILEVYESIKKLNAKSASVLVVGAGFIGVEWVTELQFFFKNLKLGIIDFLPNCLGPLPKKAADYCNNYMNSVGIKTTYNIKYDPKNPEFWKQVGFPDGVDKEYVCIGVKASNYFMPKETLSDKGPGGGGWIYINKKLQVTDKDLKPWANGKIFAVGDCNFGCIGNPPDWKCPDGSPGMPPIPKISYPGEEQALHACKNIELMDCKAFEPRGCLSFWDSCGYPVPELKDTWWPWGAGMFATSLGPEDACFVLAANDKKGSGYMVNWWVPSAIQKELIESTKVGECRDDFLPKLVWYFVHHTPVNCWGRGPFLPSPLWI